MTLKQISPDYDLRRKDSRERALQELAKLIRLKREGSLDKKELLLLEKVLLVKSKGLKQRNDDRVKGNSFHS